MRTIIVFVMLTCSVALNAQTILPFSFMNYLHEKTIATTADKKWSVSAYSGLSAGYSYFNGGGATFVSAPVSLQLNRQLNQNLYAFAAVTAAPAYLNFNHSFLNSDLGKAYSNNRLFNYGNGPGAYSRAELGLMYVNDAKTFSISGSVGVQRSSYPVYGYQPRSGAKQTSPVRN